MSKNTRDIYIKENSRRGLEIYILQETNFRTFAIFWNLKGLHGNLARVQRQTMLLSIKKNNYEGKRCSVFIQLVRK
jgi:hypothetical protein